LNAAARPEEGAAAEIARLGEALDEASRRAGALQKELSAVQAELDRRNAELSDSRGAEGSEREERGALEARLAGAEAARIDAEARLARLALQLEAAAPEKMDPSEKMALAEVDAERRTLSERVAE